MELKATGALIGHLGLRFLNQFEQTELLYLLDRSVWGHGLATEGGRAAPRFGLDTLALPRIIAMAMPENAASLAVMRRLGMTRRGRRIFLGYAVEWADIAKSAPRGDLPEPR